MYREYVSRFVCKARNVCQRQIDCFLAVLATFFFTFFETNDQLHTSIN